MTRDLFLKQECQSRRLRREMEPAEQRTVAVHIAHFRTNLQRPPSFKWQNGKKTNKKKKREQNRSLTFKTHVNKNLKVDLIKSLGLDLV